MTRRATVIVAILAGCNPTSRPAASIVDAGARDTADDFFVANPTDARSALDAPDASDVFDAAVPTDAFQAPDVPPSPCRFIESLHESDLPVGTVPIRVETVVSGLSQPWSIAFLPGGDLLVTERNGRLRRVHQGALIPTPVVSPDIASIPGDPDPSTGEGGLLGIALDPAFASNRRFFMAMTVAAPPGDAGFDRFWFRVVRYRLSDDFASADVDRIILDRIPWSIRYPGNHAGGRLRFGPDGMLYVSTGDAENAGYSQASDVLAGKILRLTPDGDVPSDNPVSGQAWIARGIRNCQGLAWLSDGTLLFTDHGPSNGGNERFRGGADELNVLARPGSNFGWPYIYQCQQLPGVFEAPALTFRYAVPPGGLAVYTGAAIPEWRGSVIVASLARALVRVQLDPTNPQRVTAVEAYWQRDHGRLRDAIMGPDGELYVTTANCFDRFDRGIAPCDRILRITR